MYLSHYVYATVIVFYIELLTIDSKFGSMPSGQVGSI